MIRHEIWGRPLFLHPADTSCSWPPFQRWYLMTFAIRMSLHLPVRKAKFEQIVVRSLSANPCNIVIADNYIIHKDFKHQQWDLLQVTIIIEPMITGVGCVRRLGMPFHLW